jgi:hypothetical protein
MTPSNNKPFVVMLMVAVVIGVGIGGIFAGGVALGKSSGEDTPTYLIPGGPSANSTGAAGQGGPVPSRSSQRSEGRLNSAGIGGQSPDPASGDAAGQRFPGRGGVTGAVEKVERNVATITTPEGPIEVTLGEDTSLSRISEASVDDLQPGIPVTVMGPAGKDGRIEAASVIITPEGMKSPSGWGPRGGQGVPRGSDEP